MTTLNVAEVRTILLDAYKLLEQVAVYLEVKENLPFRAEYLAIGGNFWSYKFTVYDLTSMDAHDNLTPDEYEIPIEIFASWPHTLREIEKKNKELKISQDATTEAQEREIYERLKRKFEHE